MRRTAVTVALVGLVLLGAVARQAVGAEPQCFTCNCEEIPTACAASPIDVSQCPTCPTGGPTVGYIYSPCNEVAACRPFLSRAPALSPIPLAGLGLLLVGTGVWLTRKRTRAAL